MLVDIISPKYSDKAFRLIKSREKMRKIIEARHELDHSSLMRAF